MLCLTRAPEPTQLFMYLKRQTVQYSIMTNPWGQIFDQYATKHRATEQPKNQGKPIMAFSLNDWFKTAVKNTWI